MNVLVAMLLLALLCYVITEPGPCASKLRSLVRAVRIAPAVNRNELIAESGAVHQARLPLSAREPVPCAGSDLPVTSLLPKLRNESARWS